MDECGDGGEVGGGAVLEGGVERAAGGLGGVDIEEIEERVGLVVGRVLESHCFPLWLVGVRESVMLVRCLSRMLERIL